MRTVLIILGGLALMAVFLGIARIFAREKIAVAFAAFAVLWVAVAAANMWVGVVQAGYSFMEELPIFLVIAAVPIVVGYTVQMKLRKT
jgi:hypothetical protein